MRKMKRLFVSSAALFLVACSDSTGLDPDDLAGTWTASEWVLTNLVNSAQTFNVLGGGGSMTIEFRADGTFTSTIRGPGDATADVDTGTYTVVGATLTIAESGQGSPTSFTAVRDGDTMTLTNSDEDYDFDGDGTDEDASQRIVLNRS